MKMRGVPPHKPEPLAAKEICMEPWMREKLEELRREQERGQERPCLRLPLRPLPNAPRREEKERERVRGVVVVDLNV